MKLIDVLNELEKALEITEEKLYHRLIIRMIEDAQNPRYIKTLEKIKVELEKPRADLSPNEIWLEQSWTTGKLFTQDVFDIHYIYYSEVRKFITDNVEEKGIRDVLIPIFSFPLNYKFGEHSQFHSPSSSYKRFLESRTDKLKIIRKLMEKP